MSSSCRVFFALVAVGIAVSSTACEEDPGGPAPDPTDPSSDSSSSSSSGSSGSSGSNEPPSSTPPPSTLPQGTRPTFGDGVEYCEKTWGLVHAGLEACCTAEEQTTLDFILRRSSYEELVSRCKSALEESISKGRILIRQSEADACYAAYADNHGPDHCPNLSPSVPAVSRCSNVFTGVGGEGAPCIADYECLDGLTCVGYTSSSEGECKAPPAIGEPCGPAPGDQPSLVSMDAYMFGTHPRCAPGARCHPETRTCVKAAVEGESCSSKNDCAWSLECVTGKCARQLADEGADCDEHDDCASGLYCEATTRKCTKKKVAGEACRNIAECHGRCDPSLGCKSYCGSL